MFHVMIAMAGISPRKDELKFRFDPYSLKESLTPDLLSKCHQNSFAPVQFYKRSPAIFTGGSSWESSLEFSPESLRDPLVNFHQDPLVAPQGSSRRFLPQSSSSPS
jgi:hypothetical protein